MVADSITEDSQLSHGSPITRDVFKKRKAYLLRKLKQCKVDGAHQWTVEDDETVVLSDNSSDDDYSDALSMFNEEEDPSESNKKSSSTTEKPEPPSPEEKATDEEKEDDDCPLCAEKMDATDLLFEPCSSCEYKMCLFCYNKIKVGTGVCPGCRTKYEQQTSSNSGEVSFQQRGGDPIRLSSSFQGLDDDSA
ncbi:hypothetical protein F2Q70_00016082 [Brassica cretica]|uniref:RING-type domain-containing protein n=1 Tax=Brassica cretica TaxID=69181 RepID=A0A8S9HZK3_BRACR|nr:hypothetical protein F2Q70_00016082 [Brassica cretica]KAF2596654.1 hypothetical protein F2Q68_00009014 [Brassica cretica]